MKKEYHYLILILFSFCVNTASKNIGTVLSMDGVELIFQLIFYIMVIQTAVMTSQIVFNVYQYGRIDLKPIVSNKIRCYVYFLLMALLMTFKSGWLKLDMFFYLTVAYVVVNYMTGDMFEIGKKYISYGEGMACSFYEGYLATVLPNDGADFVGIEKKIEKYENMHRVTFPVRRLFIIINKKLYCPPDLAEFNKPNNNSAILEACTALEPVIKDVAGVKDRYYKNSIYKIHRPGARPVYIAAECATPLHTLQKVKERRGLYEELENADFDGIVEDFKKMLEKILSNSKSCCNKCQLVYYDDTNGDLNLADLLLEKIKELNEEFE